MSNIYSHWDSDKAMEQFGEPRGLFRSETYFLEKITHSDMSILDVGCGTGALYHALKDKYAELKYTGVDIADSMLKRAREINPGCQWLKGNFLADNFFGSEAAYDLTFATGVFQHEPETEKLFSNMLKHTKEGGFSLFDVKLFHTHPTLRNSDISYCDLDDRLYFVVFYFNDLLRMLLKYEEVVEIEIYGYYAGTNKSVRLPASVVEEVCSAHVLIHKGKRNSESSLPVTINLPKDFIINYGKKENFN